MDERDEDLWGKSGHVPKLNDGKDELNLAEFPLCSISDRIDPATKTLVFEDTVYDASKGGTVPRQLTITASDKFGLPTALDEEVILGLIQLTKFQNFTERRVHFSRYQLLKLLGWSGEGKSYDRLEKSLNRWVGVTLIYKNAWWNREEKSWVDESFHILENLTLYDRDKRQQLISGRQPSLPLSSFVWNDVIFRSFRAGNLKSIDFDFYKSLNSAVAKRLYRFLDKRFWRRKRWEFDLREVSFEHVGISRNYDISNVKRKLLTGIRELEERNYLTPMSLDDRFKKIRAGDWRVVFEKIGSPDPVPESSDERRGLVNALVERGVTPSTAEIVAADFAAERIQQQIEIFDWLRGGNDSKIARNPAGFLVASIKGEYAPPKDFVPREERARRQVQALERKQKEEAKEAKRIATEEAKARAKEDAIDRFWSELTKDERQRLEEEALLGASTIERDLIERGGPFANATKKQVLDAYALQIMVSAG